MVQEVLTSVVQEDPTSVVLSLVVQEDPTSVVQEDKTLVPELPVITTEIFLVSPAMTKRAIITFHVMAVL